MKLRKYVGWLFVVGRCCGCVMLLIGELGIGFGCDDCVDIGLLCFGLVIFYV